MKKNLMLSVVIVLTIIASTVFLSDGLTYLITSLMALVIMGTIYRNRSRVMKMTRWSKANPRKAQLLITGLQIVLIVLGVFTGNNLKELGYEFSNTTAFVFGAIIFIGFLYVPFLPKRNVIAIPKVVNRQRFAFMSIALSSFVMMVLFGNKLQDTYPNSPITQIVKSIDQAIFPDNNTQANLYDIASDADLNKNNDQALADKSTTKAVFASFVVNESETIIPPTDLKKESKTNLKADKKTKKFEKKKARLTTLLKKHRLTLAGMSAGLAVVLIILLCIPLCAGICLILSGGSAGSILGGIALTGASIFGIIKVAKSSRKSKEEKL
jgi:hypothetical protein